MNSTIITKKADDDATESTKVGKIRRFFRVLGPGLITGASDDDPSGIATYATTGASLGYSVLWTAIFTYPLMVVVQLMCSRIAMVTGRDLGAVMRKHFPTPVAVTAVLLLLVANTINAGTDLGAVAAAVNMLCPAVPALVAIVPVTLIIIATITWGSYRVIEKTFKWLTLTLFVYVATAFCIHADWPAALKNTVVPTIHWNKEFLTAIVGILGTTISPYLFFWQSSLEVEAEKAKGMHLLSDRQGCTQSELTDATIDINTGMLFSNVVMYFILFTTAATLFVAGKTQINSAQDAALALKPFAGEHASQLFALGIIGTGFLAIPVLTGSAVYALSAVFAWKSGLDEKPNQAKKFYLAIAASTAVGMLLNFFKINTMAALFWTAVINGFLAPPLLLLIMLICNDRKIMGDKVNSLPVNIVGWATVALMTAAAIAVVVTSIGK